MPKSELDQIRAAAERYPEAEAATLFGDHEVYRVKKKVFLWLGDSEKGGAYVGVKLKDTQQMALSLPFCSPMAYGMAKYGWTNADFPTGKAPMSMVLQWIEESYRHTAPKKLLKQLDEAQGKVPKTSPTKRAPAKKKKRG